MTALTTTSDTDLADVVAEAQAQFDDADFRTALDTLRRESRRPNVLADAAYVFLLARILRALSEYEAAADTLTLLHRDAFLTSRAQTEASQLAWVQHDHELARSAASTALRANPTNPAARAALRRAEVPVTPDRDHAPTGGVAHAAFYVSEGGNFGDVVLPLAVRRALVAATGPIEFLPIHVHQVFDDARLELANAQRAVVVGGGGLFLPDTAPNGNSGWQWNIPRSSLERIEVPLAAFAVGYNLFSGQRFHGDLFTSNLVALAEKAEFLGLRNHGSVDRVRGMLPPRLQDRVRFVPCPTTVLGRILSDLPEPGVGSGRVLLNVAYDRSARRFGDGYDTFLAEMESFVDALTTAGAEVAFASHLPGDERFVRDIAAAYGRHLPVERLNLMTPEEGYALYSRAALVVGMRGHATMIPFGLGTPVLSIVSHPKMRFFLEDVGRPEWAVDVDDPRLGSVLAERALDVLAAEDRYRTDVQELQVPLLGHVDSAAEDLLGSTSLSC